MIIKNQRAYAQTQTRVRQLQDAIDDLERSLVDDGSGHKTLKLRTLAAQVAELQEQLDRYEALSEGRVEVGPIRSLHALSRALVEARIAAGLTQAELAERLGLKAQQVQRYEATNYESASLRRLLEVADALQLSAAGLALPGDLHVTAEDLVAQLADEGLPSDVAKRRILPRWGDASSTAILEAAERIGRVFGADVLDVLRGTPTTLRRQEALAAQFKLRQGTDVGKVAPYTVYAHYIAVLARTVAAPRPFDTDPPDPQVLHRVLRGVVATGSTWFEAVLDHTWESGAVVLPLADPGTFHGACWWIDDAPVVALKQQTRYGARWAFDLLHELHHVFQTSRSRDVSIIDVEDPMSASPDTPEEMDANEFAGIVLLGQGREEVIEICVTRAGGSVERLKGVLPGIAAEFDLDLGALANYLAWRLSLQGINWWGAATNLQRTGPDPWAIARDELLRRSKLAALNDIDRELLLQALSDEDELP